MTIEDTEECTFGPDIALLIRRLHYIEYDRDAVFIVVTDYSLIGVCSISNDHSILSNGTFGRLEVGQSHLERIGRGSIAE